MNDEAIQLLTELLRLYDWRKELDVEEKWCREARKYPGRHDKTARLSRQRKFFADQRQREVQYAAAMERTRELLTKQGGERS